MTAPTPKQIRTIAEVGGLAVTDEMAQRMAQAIGPAYEGFAAVAGTLPMDIEPATFLLVQNTKAAT